MRKINKAELAAILATKPKRKYALILNDVENVGNPRHGITDVCGYTDDNGEIIIYEIYRNRHFFMIDDPSRKTVDFLKCLICEILPSSEECAIVSCTDGVLRDPYFTALFGTHEILHGVEYGMFTQKPYKKANDSLTIRLLTEDDADIVDTFDEPVVAFRANLKEAYKECMEDPNNVVYGAFLDGILVSYLYVETFDGKFWDIVYIYTSESYRGRGIAADLANFYGASVTKSGAFASYGSADNDSSARTAIKAGFEEFGERFTIYLKK